MEKDFSIKKQRQKYLIDKCKAVKIAGIAQRRLHLPSKQDSETPWVRVPLPAQDSMINACKFCENKIPAYELGDDWWCPKCQQYSIVCSDSVVESETLRSGNYYLTFFPAYKTASIVETKDVNKRVLRTLEMDELTHEQACHWVKKLKTYVLFQQSIEKLYDVKQDNAPNL